MYEYRIARHPVKAICDILIAIVTLIRAIEDSLPCVKS